MVQFYRRGIDAVLEGPSVTRMAPQFEKRFYVRKEEGRGQFIILTPNLRDAAVFWEHTVFVPGRKDKIAAQMRVPCPEYERAEDAPTTCKICSIGMFNDAVKRSKVGAIYVIDVAQFKDDSGKLWGHTPKWYVMRKKVAELLAAHVREQSPEGNCAGMLFTVFRKGDNSPATGDSFQFKDFVDLETLKVNSPRASWYRDKVLRTGREISLKEAGEEFFAIPDPDKVFVPTQRKINYFCSYVENVFGKTTGGESFGVENPKEPPPPTWDVPLVGRKSSSPPSFHPKPAAEPKEFGYGDLPIASGGKSNVKEDEEEEEEVYAAESPFDGYAEHFDGVAEEGLVDEEKIEAPAEAASKKADSKKEEEEEEPKKKKKKASKKKSKEVKTDDFDKY